MYGIQIVPLNDMNLTSPENKVKRAQCIYQPWKNFVLNNDFDQDALEQDFSLQRFADFIESHGIPLMDIDKYTVVNIAKLKSCYLEDMEDMILIKKEHRRLFFRVGIAPGEQRTLWAVYDKNRRSYRLKEKGDIHTKGVCSTNPIVCHLQGLANYISYLESNVLPDMLSPSKERMEDLINFLQTHLDEKVEWRPLLNKLNRG